MSSWRLFTYLLLCLGVVGWGPIGCWAGGELSGKVHEGPPPDWASVANTDAWAQLETRPDDPYSIHIWAASHEGRLFVPTSLILGPDVPTDRTWVQNVLADPAVRLKLGDTLYRLRAERVTDEDLAAAVKAALMALYDPEADPDDHYRGAWVFELVPR